MSSTNDIFNLTYGDYYMTIEQHIQRYLEKGGVIKVIPMGQKAGIKWRSVLKDVPSQIMKEAA